MTSRINRILAQYSDLAALNEDDHSQRVISWLRQIKRLPNGAADCADELLSDLRRWNGCYGPDGYLNTGADVADRAAREVTRTEIKMLAILDMRPA